MSSPENNEHEALTSKPWSRRAQDIAAVAWSSFLVAAAATMVVFGVLDPARLDEATALDWHFSRLGGYSVGFFFLWLVTAASSLTTLYLLRTRSADRRSRGPAP